MEKEIAQKIIEQRLDKLKDIQQRLEELILDLQTASCAGIYCDECPVQRFCALDLWAGEEKKDESNFYEICCSER